MSKTTSRKKTKHIPYLFHTNLDLTEEEQDLIRSSAYGIIRTIVRRRISNIDRVLLREKASNSFHNYLIIAGLSAAKPAKRKKKNK
jgi:hypothetical protein